MEQSIQEILSTALNRVKSESNTREAALAATKIQEAMMWVNAHQQALSAAAKKAGVGFTNNVNQAPPSPPQMENQHGNGD